MYFPSARSPPSAPMQSHEPYLILAASSLPSRMAPDPRLASHARGGTSVSALEVSLASIFNQTRGPDEVILSLPKTYRRTVWGREDAWTSAAAAEHAQRLGRANLHVQTADDEGPGTKLLAALPLARRLAATRGLRRREPWLVLFDDDVAYDSLALQWLAGHIKATPAAEELRRAVGQRDSTSVAHDP